MQITVIDDSKAEKCEAHCGIDWSSKEAITLINQRIKERFGGRVKLEYLDLSKPRTGRALELNQLVKDENRPLPLLVINGQPRISGQFDIRHLLDAVDAEMEIRAQCR